MHSGKQQALPRNPEWRLISPNPREPGSLALTAGTALLHLRFWPDAFASIRLEPNAHWHNGYRYASRLLEKLLRPNDCHERTISGSIYLEDPVGQIQFPFIYAPADGSEEERVTSALAAQAVKIPSMIRTNLLGLCSAARWRALELASRLPAAAELLADHPQLFYIWLNTTKLRPSSERFSACTDRQIGTLPPESPSSIQILSRNLRLPRHQQLGLAGFSTEKFWLRVLHKIPLNELHMIRWKALASLSLQEIPRHLRKFLQHSDHLSASALRCISSPEIRPFLTESILRSFLKEPRYDLHPPMATFIRYIKHFPRSVNYLKPPRNLTELTECAEELTSLLRALDHSPQKPRPQSPLPCPQDWTHLNTIDLLLEEGHLQRNCLRDQMMAGVSTSPIIYRVMKPVRATVAVDKGPNGLWQLRECSGKSNTAIAPEIQHQLLETLAGNQLPQIKETSRVEFLGAPAPSTALYQRIPNSHTLDALYLKGQLHFRTHELDEGLQRGDYAAYRIRIPQVSALLLKNDPRYGWDFKAHLHRIPSPNHTIMVATHIIWRHFAALYLAHGAHTPDQPISPLRRSELEADLPTITIAQNGSLTDWGAEDFAPRFATPTWAAPPLPIPDYCPAENLWELLQFRWLTGCFLSLEDILERSSLAFFCHVEGCDIAVRVRFPGRLPPSFEFYLPRSKANIAPVFYEAFTEIGNMVQAHFATHKMGEQNYTHGPDRFIAPPELSSVRQVQELTSPKFRHVY